MRGVRVAMWMGAMLLVGGLGCSSAPAGQDGQCDDCAGADADEKGEVAGDATNGGGSGGGDGGSGSADGGGIEPGACEKRSNFLVVRRPNILFLLDTSSSMEGEPMNQAKAALDEMAATVAEDVRVGIGGFPVHQGCTSERLLQVGDHDEEAIEMSYSGLTAGGGTPTGRALKFVREGSWLVDDEDPADDERRKAVVLITDGEPNDSEICDPADEASAEAANLADQGSPVYVVGFRAEGDPDVLDAIAEAGGTEAPGEHRFYETSDTGGLTAALTGIADGSVSCSFDLDPAPPRGASVNVTVGGEQVPSDREDGYRFDQESGDVEVTGEWCQTLQERGRGGTTLEIDVGCPTCSLAGESCESDDDCCDEQCENGTCVERCQANGEQCTADSDCCGGRCGTENGEMIGRCTGQ